MRCLHLNRVGEQCRDQALADRQLCAYHAQVLEGYEPKSVPEDEDEPRPETSGRTRPSPRFPLIYRLAAALLLFIFLMDLFPILRDWLDW